MYREISTYTYVFDSQRWEYHKYESEKPTQIPKLLGFLILIELKVSTQRSLRSKHTWRDEFPFQYLTHDDFNKYIHLHTLVHVKYETNDTARSVRVAYFFRCRFALPKQLLCCARHRNDDEVNARLFHVNGFIYIHCGVYRWDIVVGLSECVCMCARVYLFYHLCVLWNIDKSVCSLERLGLHAMEWGKKPIHSVLAWMSKRYGVRFSVSGSSIGFSCLYKPHAQVNKTP